MYAGAYTYGKTKYERYVDEQSNVRKRIHHLPIDQWDLGRDIGLTVMPRWARKALGLVVPMIREINEMMYQWDEPFVIDGQRFRATFNTEPTEPQRAAADTVTWAKSHYGIQRA